MRYAVVERWSQGDSPLHRRDPRAKIGALLVFLLIVATAHRALVFTAGGLFLLLACGFLWARLPLPRALLRAALVLPFAVLFGVISWAAGDPGRAVSLVLKSYLSTLAVLLVVSTTPLSALIRGLELTRSPQFVLLVAQFLYRYLFVIGREAQQMSRAAAARGASARKWMAASGPFRAAAGALAALFARSYNRAEHIHRAMLARCFQGHFQTVQKVRFRPSDAVFVLLASLAPLAVRIVAERATP